MIKITLYSIIAIFALSACQGRGMQLHPSNKNKAERGAKVRAPLDENIPVLKLKTKALPNTKATVKNTIANHMQSTPNTLPTIEKPASNVDIEKKSVLASIPIVNSISTSMLPSIGEIPVLRNLKKLLPKKSGIAKFRVKNTKTEAITTPKTESFSGGSMIDGLDIGLVRLGQSSTYTRLIFDSYKWEGYAQIPIKKVNHSGTYIFTYDGKHKIITAILDGYQAFSALVGDHEDLYKDNNMVKTIHLDEYLDKSGFKFTIELKQEARIKVYELHYPGRIVIDMYPL